MFRLLILGISDSRQGTNYCVIDRRRDEEGSRNYVQIFNILRELFL